MRKNKAKTIFLSLILAMVVVASFSFASAKTVRDAGAKGAIWKYGRVAVGNGGYSEYYHPNSIHWAKVTLTNGKSDTDWNFPKMGYFSSGWAKARKTALWASQKNYQAGKGDGPK